MSGKYMRFSLAAAAAVLSGSAFAMVGPGDYVRDGLVVMYDAVYNAVDAQGALVHDANATTWHNIVCGASDLTLPAGGYTIGEKAVSLSAVASATGCVVSNSTGTITAEFCGYSTASSITGNERACLNLVSRIQLGYHKSNGAYSAAPNNSTWASAKWGMYYSSENTGFANYATVDRTMSYLASLGGPGVVYTNGYATTRKSYWTQSSTGGAPTGELKVGNAGMPCTFHSVRLYSRALTADEVKLNAAIDAVRFRGVDPATVALPTGYSFDAATNLVSTAWANQHRITEPGTVTFAAPTNSTKKLVNAALGTVTFDESGKAKDKAHAISFVGFDALGFTTSLFKGGWWDFGAGDFFSSTSVSTSRTTVFDGSVVTNVGAVHVAGTSGDDNRLDLKNGAKMYPASMTLGWKKGANQRSKVTVTGGSTLEIAGKLNLSDTATQCMAITITENELLVSNANSRLVVKGTTGLAQKSTEGSYGATGGNTLIVTDKAVADLQTISVSRQNGCNVSNRITVAKGGLLTSENLYCSTDPSYSGWTAGNWNRFEVLDGGVWTNRNAFSMGQYQHAAHIGNTLLVSNGTFHTKYIGAGSGNDVMWFRGRDTRIIISGPKAKFTVESFGTSGYLFCNPAGEGSELIVENNADWTATKDLRYTYMGGSTRGALVARSGGIFRANFGFTTGSANSQTLLCKSTENAMRAESDGQFVIAGLTVVGLRGQLVVDNGRVTSSGGVTIGHYKATAKADWTEVGSNCVMRLSGDHPAVTAAGKVAFADKVCSTLEVNLPATGYLATHACSTQALVMASTITFGAENASIVLNGAEAFAAHQAQVGKSATYVLLSAPTLTIPEYVLTAAQATLPSTCRLSTRTVSVGGENRKELVLRVSANRGMVVLIK